MPGVTLTEVQDALLTTTLKHYHKKLIDNLFNAFVLFDWLRRKGRARAVNGGETIIEHLLYETNDTATAYDNYGTILTTPQEGMTVAQYKWRNYAVSVSISGPERRKNMGEHQLIDLAEAKVRQAELSLFKTLTDDLWANITASPSLKLDGILLHIADANTTSVVGGLDPATYLWWRNQRTGSGGAYSSNLLNKLRTLYYNCSAGPTQDPPDLIIASQTGFEYYEAASVGNQRFLNNELMDAGFMNFKFKGATLTFDKALASGVPASGETYVLVNSNYMSLVYHPKANMTPTEKVKPDNQDSLVNQILWMGNLTNNNRRRHGILTGITAS